MPEWSTCRSMDELLKLPEFLKLLRITRRLSFYGQDAWNLPGSDFEEFSAALPELSQLTDLTIGWCNWREAPRTIATLKQLRSLSIVNAPISRFPDFLDQCPKLTKLIVRGTDISEGPPSSTMLPKLKYLDLGNNGLTEIPIKIGNLGNLRHLMLPDNHFSVLPEDMVCLRRLCTLGLANNPFLLKEELGRISDILPKTKIYHYLISRRNRASLSIRLHRFYYGGIMSALT